MKRFYCKFCKRHRRVRQLPIDVTPIYNLDDSVKTYGQGTCRQHDRTVSLSVLHSRRRVIAGIGSTRKTAARAAKSKSKKG